MTINEKQKLVDEMAELIESAKSSVENWHCRNTSCSNCTYTHCKNSAIAEELLEYYQPKLPEGSVVISKKEYELLTDISALKGKVQEALNINPIEELIQVEREARKQAIKEVLGRLKELWQDEAASCCTLLSDIDEIAREKGVDLCE